MRLTAAIAASVHARVIVKLASAAKSCLNNTQGIS
tara:strand:+ start:352 stop:456 length:105 start_codon:yes stop_codon:yes gene_type:complete